MRTRREIYCDILRTGLLRIRSHADDRELCFAQADHLHNLPSLLKNDGNEDLHRYYWEVERPSFMQASKPEYLTVFQDLWAELAAANQKARPS